MNFGRIKLFLFLAVAAIVAGCTNRDKANQNKNYDDLYFDYNITAEEGDENVSCVFQYKNGDVEGKAVSVEPAKVELDGQQLSSDSAKLSGFFYEAEKPLDSFAGKHVIVFATEDQQYKNEFTFSPFTLKEELPQKIARKPFTIQLKNFPSTEKSLRLLLLDTAFQSHGFNDLVPVADGKIIIDEAILSTIEKGPINLELYMEQELPLKQATKAGGKISITYGLKREFELVD